MRTQLLVTLLLVITLICAVAPVNRSQVVSAQTRPKTQQKATRYACPMHPEVASSRPGKCPKCGMALRAVSAEPATTSNHNPAGTTAPETAEDSVSLHIPDTPVYDQNGKRLNFYTDLVKGHTVAINFIFTTCTTICPPLTATFRRVQVELGARAGRDVQLISVSVDPTTDVPERLQAFATKFKAGPGWTFVTGEKTEIDALLKALGTAVTDKNDHTPMILVGNDTAHYWTRTYGLAPPSALVRVISEVAAHK